MIYFEKFCFIFSEVIGLTYMKKFFSSLLVMVLQKLLFTRLLLLQS